jgi:hypothetical protein
MFEKRLNVAKNVCYAVELIMYANRNKRVPEKPESLSIIGTSTHRHPTLTMKKIFTILPLTFLLISFAVLIPLYLRFNVTLRETHGTTRDVTTTEFADPKIWTMM